MYNKISGIFVDTEWFKDVMNIDTQGELYDRSYNPEKPQYLYMNGYLNYHTCSKVKGFLNELVEKDIGLNNSIGMHPKPTVSDLKALSDSGKKIKISFINDKTWYSIDSIGGYPSGAYALEVSGIELPLIGEYAEDIFLHPDRDNYHFHIVIDLDEYEQIKHLFDDDEIDPVDIETIFN
jgi:hypothetical protein